MAFLARASSDRRLRPRTSAAAVVMRILLVLIALPIILVPVYSVVPPVSTLMLARWATGRPVERVWTPLDQISPALQRAVLVSEDARFCQHHGVDWGAIGGVLKAGGDSGPGRGASTIAMLVAKNLFLWQGGAYLRKPLEIALAHWIDLVWSKRRVMEVYLNIAEWGPEGQFGVDAGARRAFGIVPDNLDWRTATLLVTALPNPMLRQPGRPSDGMLRIAAILRDRVAEYGERASCVGEGGRLSL